MVQSIRTVRRDGSSCFHSAAAAEQVARLAEAQRIIEERMKELWELYDAAP